MTTELSKDLIEFNNELIELFGRHSLAKLVVKYDELLEIKETFESGERNSDAYIHDTNESIKKFIEVINNNIRMFYGV